MRRYGRGRRTSVTDQKRKENALKFYEPHLSAETRREFEEDKKAVKRISDQVRRFSVDTSNDSIS